MLFFVFGSTRFHSRSRQRSERGRGDVGGTGCCAIAAAGGRISLRTRVFNHGRRNGRRWGGYSRFTRLPRNRSRARTLARCFLCRRCACSSSSFLPRPSTVVAAAVVVTAIAELVICELYLSQVVGKNRASAAIFIFLPSTPISKKRDSQG